MEQILIVKNLCKTYIVNKRQNNVLKNINFTVSGGEMVAVMGPSGSGKSTLLYAVSGMDSITAGEVLFCGRNLSSLSQKELADLRLNEMGFIFQQMYMLKNLTILDNIVLPAFQSKKNTAGRKEKVQTGQDLMRKLGIIEIADNDINEVSGGQLQRACICRSRFDYTVQAGSANRKLFLICNLSLAIMALLTIGILLFADTKILKPFHTLRNVPYELSKGNLTVPMKESKNRFFGRFIWGVDMLRENMEQQKQRELQLQRDKKTLLLSISHDIKTPLSAIKLYSQALSKGLYKSADKQTEIARNINAKADEIEAFVSQIIQASNEDFLNLEVVPGEFYLSHLINNISVYYKEKLSLIRIAFSVSSFSDCILKGDPDRSVEVLQNIIENAVKYGNGHSVEIRFAEEEDCQLITIINEGCTLPESELPHIFDSFWRGSNAGSSSGSGLGLYICRQLMHKMGGEIFAEIRDGCMHMTTVFPKAV